VAQGLKAGDPLADIAGRHWVSVAFGRGNVVLISEYLTHVMDPLDLTGPGFTIDQFKVFATKSRAHFRRGFDDSGFAKTILVAEPEQPFLGTVQFEALHYRTVDISTFYPYGDPRPFQQRSQPC
jgi:microcystin degradation protein MlrC